MSVVALIGWILTALAGLVLLAIWLIEYDPDFQRAAATRLPVPVLCGHVLFAVGGLLLWVLYVITDERVFCWAAASDLALIATLGFIMAVRWLGVYRARPGRVRAHAIAPNGRSGELVVPPERHFPVSIVIAHGVLAVTTVILVLAIAIRVARS
jgi:hypothetical protein